MASGSILCVKLEGNKEQHSCNQGKCEFLFHGLLFFEAKIVFSRGFDKLKIGVDIPGFSQRLIIITPFRSMLFTEMRLSGYKKGWPM